MSELIKISENNGQKAVSARELYLFLGYDKSQWARWSKQNIEENKFAIENVDYQTFDIMSNGNETKEFVISIDFAKRLSMMAKTLKGEQARQYFIDCEKQLKQIPDFNNPAVAARAWADEYEKRELAETKIKELAPKAEICDKISDAANLYNMNQAAKSIGIGRNKLFQLLRDKKILQSNNNPYQVYIDQEYFELKVTPILIGIEILNKCQTYVTGKGLVWLTKLISK